MMVTLVNKSMITATLLATKRKEKDVWKKDYLRLTSNAQLPAEVHHSPYM